MDTLTHALSGAIAARALWPAAPDRRRRTLAAGLAAAFPDVDYLLFWLAPLDFLALHRGPTHSALLLPLWAALLVAAGARPGHVPVRALYAACALGLALHLAGDLVTIYGTQLLWPLSSRPFALELSFDVNPWVALVVVTGWAAGGARPRLAAAATAGVLAGLFGLQGVLRDEALLLARAGVPAQARVIALPQPLSPAHWLLLADSGRDRRFAHVDLWQAALPAALPSWVRYPPPADLAWQIHPYPDGTLLAASAWATPALTGFRRFAEWPVLYRVDAALPGGGACVWFAELRHVLPGSPPSFRYGACRDGASGAAWRPYRLRYFSTDGRQPL